VRAALTDNRLVTLTGVGGAGKTRLALKVAVETASDFDDGVWYADLAPITHPDVVPATVAHALGLPDQPGRSSIDTVRRFIGDRHMLLVVDNCEHMLDASADLFVDLLGSCPRLTLLATSREPIGVTGEVGWRVPSLSLADEAIELFSDRAHRVRADFTVTDHNVAVVAEICRRLDGLPLAIELAAARIRALSVNDILDSLHDRFRLLTGGSRTAVRRQQTLRASVDWSHALLTEPERVLFRRLAVFLGGFDLDAARFVCGDADVERYQILDQLTLLVDKSLVVADDSGTGTRYHLLETVRQYALEKLGESGEADVVRARHRDHYTSLAATLQAPAGGDNDQRIDQFEIEIDNFRGALGWSLENSEIEPALVLTSSLEPLWLIRGRMREARAWFDAIFDRASPDIDVVAEVRARALAVKACLDLWVDPAAAMQQAEQALAIARQVDDPALLVKALTACSYVAGYSYNVDVAAPYFAEGIELARAVGDTWSLCRILDRQSVCAVVMGDPVIARAAAEEGRALADAIGDRADSRECRLSLGWAQLMQGELAATVALISDVLAEANSSHDVYTTPGCFQLLGNALALQGELEQARTAAQASIVAAGEVGSGFFAGLGHTVLAAAALVNGELVAAQEASDTAWQHMSLQPQLNTAQRAFNMAEVALAQGDLTTARRMADEAVSAGEKFQLATALTVRARIAMATGTRDDAERDLYDALAVVADISGYLTLPGILECLATLATASDGRRQEAARLFGAAEAFRRRTGIVRFKVHQASYNEAVTALRNAVSDRDFEEAWAEGDALSAEDAITYAQRGRGQRKRASTGWDSLTPAEVDVVRLVCEGLGNKDIATRLFISPRTVQAHLTHIYTKLGLTSRVQLVQEAARRG
jgi:predicted ATPase/DNA-binding CsgD family transcriptional regulator